MRYWNSFKTYIKLKLRYFPKTFNLLYFFWSNLNPRIINNLNREKKYYQLLEKLLPKKQIYFVQVGSNDGISNDPLRKKIVKYDWKGILIEPSPIPFAKLKKIYDKNSNIEVLNIAITESGEKLNFYKVSDLLLNGGFSKKVPHWYDQLGSFVKENIEKHFHQDGIPLHYIEEISVETSTLNYLLNKRNISSLDVLHVDAEGYDIEVLKSIDLKKIPTKLIIFEHMHIEGNKKKNFISYLKKLGYKIFIFHDDIIAEKAS